MKCGSAFAPALALTLLFEGQAANAGPVTPMEWRSELPASIKGDRRALHYTQRLSVQWTIDSNCALSLDEHTGLYVQCSDPYEYFSFYLIDDDNSYRSLTMEAKIHGSVQVNNETLAGNQIFAVEY
ncbi:hypothetical protein [Sphingomonas fennica]|uniref:Uncharacterized protein n=1 Tax=Edaphosphingomonas fennica TaxID=114404 RepID=A0A2T4I5K7_9SPHN|nr:hypothetical protein [Sphingomonas fennica]PTD25470.1 hypothetical protein CV103_05705 [Sphingomonas fennica]